MATHNVFSNATANMVLSELFMKVCSNRNAFHEVQKKYYEGILTRDTGWTYQWLVHCKTFLPASLEKFSLTLKRHQVSASYPHFKRFLLLLSVAGKTPWAALRAENKSFGRQTSSSTDPLTNTLMHMYFRLSLPCSIFNDFAVYLKVFGKLQTT